jgi:hypothetical protein
MPIPNPYNVIVIVRPAPNNKAILRPFFAPLPILSGIIMNTSGRVQGKIIIDNPARYAITSQEGYDNCCPAPIAVSFVAANTPPTKISEKRTNKEITSDFFVAESVMSLLAISYI